MIDPTLLLEYEDYDVLASDRLVEEKYLLIYSRRYNSKMEDYAERMAKQNGWKIVEISLRATNAEKGHIMFYQAGVEEFLSLVKHAEFVVTNSFHGIILSAQFRRQFVIFSREIPRFRNSWICLELLIVLWLMEMKRFQKKLIINPYMKE